MISEVIKKRRDKLVLKEGYVSLLLRIIVLAILGYLVFTQVFLLTRAAGNEMFPAVKDGDLIICFRLQKNYAKNDIVSYRVNGKRKLGRCIAQANDVVTIDAAGTLRINGTVQSGEIMYPTYAKAGLTYPYKVPADHVFILGDFRTQATDSRDFGAIPRDDVDGKVITLLRRRGL
ncbi:MAG TPA: signal peptidase I [Firmicutes bacterium]|jgi:signal peptidase I|nr:signal peptidase I [Bacillota bacterium]HAA37375.1 signal peptidase I [Bacillota bacterium]